MNILSLLVTASTALTLAACTGGSGGGMATPERIIQTSAGDIECQLYTLDTVMWDEALVYPATISNEQANRMCFDLGWQTKYGVERSREKGRMTFAKSGVRKYVITE